MVSIKCNSCQCRWDIDEKKIDYELEYMMCPICKKHFTNPFWEGYLDGGE